MDVKNLFTYIFFGQIYEKNLIQTALANQLRWQVINVIGGGDNEYTRPVFRQPSQQRAQYAP
jgi:spermidine synthase